jgi:hypothetical protein
LANIQRALRDHEPQPGCKLPDEFDAFDTFVGYVMFDALVANRDRHDENWAVLLPPVPGLKPALAGSFDHARALGCALPEKRIAAELAKGLDGFVKGGTAWRFERDPAKPVPTLVEVARQALGMVRPQVRGHWLDRVQNLTTRDVMQVTRRVSGLSEVVSTFVEQVVEVNRGRVLDDC